MEEIIVGDKCYRLVTLRGRTKWISRDGDAINPIKMRQRATIHMNRDGYPCFGGGVPVHLYVAHAWVDGWFDGAEVDHIDYDRKNYSASNLRWVSHLENVEHSSSNTDHYRRSKVGELNGRSAFTKEEVDAIRELFDKGMTTMGVISKLHPDYNYSQRKSVWNRYNRVKNGDTWK